MTPIESLGLGSVLLKTLKSKGVIYAEQFADFEARLPPKLSQEYRQKLQQVRASVPKTTAFRRPELGVLHPNYAPQIMRSVSWRRESSGLIKHVDRLLPPEEFMGLVDFNTKVRDQQDLGSCVGWASSASREITRNGEILSPLFAYRLAKKLDQRPDLVGSWLAYACLGITQYGHVLEDDLPYNVQDRDCDVGHLFGQARIRRAEDFVDLRLPNRESPKHINLFKAILSGCLIDELGPTSIAISIAVYESFDDLSAYRYGLITVPNLDHDFLLGGHAVQLVAYTQLGGVDFFVFKNSWGEKWAYDNPLGLRGYGLLPATYLADNRLLWEAYIFLAEESPFHLSRWSKYLRPFLESQPVMAMPSFR